MPPPAGETRALGARVAFVHETAADRARPGIHVFVVAPHCEVGAAVVQLQRQIADRMRQIEADDGTGGMAETRDFFQIERLSGAVLHAGPYDQREAFAVFDDGAFDRAH